MSTDLTDVLRKRNKYLLEQLREQREKLERVSGCSSSRKREREAEEEEQNERRQSEVVVTLTEGRRGPARAALAKPSVRFTGEYPVNMALLMLTFSQSWNSKLQP